MKINVKKCTFLWHPRDKCKKKKGENILRQNMALFIYLEVKLLFVIVFIVIQMVDLYLNLLTVVFWLNGNICSWNFNISLRFKHNNNNGYFLSAISPEST